MNEIIKNLETIEQDLDTLQTEYDAKLEIIHQEYRALLETAHKRYESYYLVAEELGLLKTLKYNDIPNTEAETSRPAVEIEGEEIGQEEIKTESRHPAQKYPLAIGDAVKKLLMEAGTSLSVKELRIRAKKLGIDPSPSTFRSAISKDSKRFERVDIGVYKLRNSENKLAIVPENYLFDSSIEDVSSNGSFQKNHDFVLINEIRNIVKEFNEREFSTKEVFEILHKRFPTNINASRSRSVDSTINNLRLKGELIKIRAGKDNEPAIYQEKRNCLNLPVRL